ncbi:MAG: hypothetical protein DRJ64_01175 [Thermoprotei archaeon]|nr:MAG: hypothetical protein DRJ64_01175 [Thermoprotei archaeon]
MNYIQQLVWDLLTLEEQTVLSLIHAQDMSLASTSKILGKRTYQVRKLNFQAIRLYRVFHEYLEKDPSVDLVIPNASPLLTKYFEQILLDKTPKNRATQSICQSMDTDNKILKSTVFNYIKELEAKKDPFLLLLREVDRYRARFLPTEFQWPSPYRRKRNKALKNLAEKLLDYDHYFFHLKQKAHKEHIYVPFANKDSFGAHTLNNTKDVRDVIGTKMQIPYFKDISDATYLGELIFNYHSVVKKTTKIGANFIYYFRKTLENADNYKELFHIPDTFIDKAFIDNDRKLKVPVDNQKTRAKYRVENTSTFYA